MNVFAYIEKIILLIDMRGIKAVLKDVALRLIGTIKITGISLQDGLHDFTWGMCCGLDEEMKMVVHEAVCMQLELVFMMGFCENQ